MVCLRCMYASPIGSTFCARCGAGFGARVCSSGHANPPTARFCTHCGKTDSELSAATNYLSIRPVAVVLACAATLGLFLYLVHHIACVLGVILTLMAAALGTSPCAVVCWIYRAAVWVIAVYLLSFLLPRGAGPWVRNAMGAVLSKAPRVLWTVARAAWRVSILLLGSAVEDHKDRKKGERKSG